MSTYVVENPRGELVMTKAELIQGIRNQEQAAIDIVRSYLDLHGTESTNKPFEFDVSAPRSLSLAWLCVVQLLAASDYRVRPL